ncbi:oligosaccharide flippase family protein [Flavobacteriaceae bacterium F08102]|nr:oligosaccharide flippase family protein [Flavobacteriaceae bacterium F08102]
MGIVYKQSLINTIILFLGFGIGGINVLFLYTHFLEESYFGLVTFMLSAANILMPILVLGMQHTIIKFFSSYQSKQEKDAFLTTVLVLPLLVIIPLSLIGSLAYQSIATWLSQKNAIIESYTVFIFITGVFMGYFEIFYAFSKVQMKSVFGNFIKEIFARVCTSLLLIGISFDILTPNQFVIALVVVYGIRTFIMMIYAFSVYQPHFSLRIPENFRELLNYSFYIILAGSASTILLEIDKFMIPQIELIAEVAYYAVGVYIASVTAIPARAMNQILTPITAKALNAQKMDEVDELYKKSSITLTVVGGLLFLLINLNVSDLYLIIDKPSYQVGTIIVLIISTAELIKLLLGANGAILTNSIYYRMFFYFSLAMALSVIFMNRWLIQLMGINGAALATLLVVFVFSVIKGYYVYKKMGLQPLTKHSGILLGIIGVLFGVFYLVKFPFNPMVNILCKSVLITLVYGWAVYRFKLSEDITKALTSLKKT